VLFVKATAEADPGVRVHEHLVLGSYSVHTNKRALDRGEAKIAEIGKASRRKVVFRQCLQGQAA
jgi:hypothetical protein